MLQERNVLLWAQNLNVLGINSCQKWGEMQVGVAERVRTSLTLQTLSASSSCHHRCLRWWIHPYLAKSESVKCFKSHNLHLVLQLYPALDSLGLERVQQESTCAVKSDTPFPLFILLALGAFLAPYGCE